jgi:protein-L-isoaspartate O-methyltransferase
MPDTLKHKTIINMLCRQPSERGIIVIPIGGYEHQVLQVIQKVSDVAKTTDLTGCRFELLIGAQGWSEE